jgi:hypothetical protein
MKTSKKTLSLKVFTPLSIQLIEMAIQNAKIGNHTYVGVNHFEDAMKKLKQTHDCLNE